MSDDIVVSGGGSTIVASDELLWHAELLQSLSSEAYEIADRLLTIDSAVDGWAITRASGIGDAAIAERAIDSARAQLLLVGLDAHAIGGALVTSAETYGRVENVIQQLTDGAASMVGYFAGLAFPSSLSWVLPALSAASGGVVGAVIATGGPRALISALPEWVKKNNVIFSNPLTVAYVRLAVNSSDDFANGVFKVPPAIAGLLGDQGLGLTGVNTTAAVLIAAGGRAALLSETPVKATSMGSMPLTQAPQGFGDRMERIPDPAHNGGSQVRIERYAMAGEPDRFEVYIAGTVDFSPIATDEPWDMTSNVAGVAGLPAGSYRAVADALSNAGVTGDSPIVFNGFSQGGLVATMLAASGDYNTNGLVTFGAPAGNIELPDTFPAIAVEHTEDIVPATGGDQVNPSVIVARRDLFAGEVVPDHEVFPAHQRDGYTTTAHLLDRQHGRLLADAAARLEFFGDGSTGVQGFLYRAERITTAR